MADTPITREEKYLAYLTGDYKGDIPKPITRQERYLYELCLKGMGGEISPEEIQEAVNDYLDKNPVKPGATTEQAQQIEQNKTDVASLKTETSSLKESISTKITKFYASSQGETHLADSDDGKIMDMMVYGKSEQKQYTGKNLFDKSTSKSAWISDDGIYIEKGEIGENTDVVSDYISVKENSTYIASFKTNYATNLIYWCTYNANKEFVSITKIANKITIPTGIRYVRVMISMQQQYCVAVNDELQVELGTEATSYEPYTGGIPSPNPDYPQEIKSVVNPTVKVCGKNLLNYKETKMTNSSDLSGIEFVENGFRMYTKKDIRYCSSMTYLDFSKLRIGETYTLSANLLIVKGVSRLTIRNRANVIIAGSSNITESGTYKIGFTLTDQMHYVSFFATFDAVVSGDVIVTNIQLEKGSVATPFEPYREQTVTLPYTLNAIPVSSGGNVTIDGQQYIAGYADVERGKLVRMVDTSKLDNTQSIVDKTEWLLAEPREIDLTEEEIAALKALSAYYPTTNISVNSEQLDGYTVFNYPVSMENGWNYVKQQIGDTRDYIYNMDARTQDTDLQAAEAYVNSEYAVALTELEV